MYSQYNSISDRGNFTHIVILLTLQVEFFLNFTTTYMLAKLWLECRRTPDTLKTAYIDVLAVSYSAPVTVATSFLSYSQCVLSFPPSRHCILLHFVAAGSVVVLPRSISFLEDKVSSPC